MPKYIVNDKTYNIPDEKVGAFESKYPDARIVYYNEGKTYKLPLGKREGFLKAYPDASLEMPKDAATVSQPTGQNLEQEDGLQQEQERQDRVSYTPAESTMVEQPKVEAKPVAVGNPVEDESENEYLRGINREQVAGLKPIIEEQLQIRGQELDAAQKEREDNMPFFARLGNNMPRGGGMAGMPEYAKTNNGRLKDRDYMTLQAASSSLENAERIIAEADHNAQKGSFSDWLERSFAGGAARALGQKTFDPRNWDMGVSDGLEASALMDALDAFDSGRPLTDTQKMLLDAKAVELATNAYFGSEVGYGYKAGSVTAESLPFMLEMLINPAAGAGNAATAKMTRYALSRFGKEALKKNAKKYMATKAITRVAGDVAGAATMAATTGATGVMADALDRMNGQVQFASDEDGNSVFLGHTEGEDFKTSLKKAYRARTIENYSEMFGNYFAPVLGAGGKMVNEGLEKIGLGKVAQFIDDVSMNDIGRLVDDFEKHAQWNGVFGEYAEEVAGGIMNACLVGDQTLDADEDTGVFNLKRNIETFLGVSLLGGFMSSVKTVGYRTPQYRARKLVDEREKAGIAAFSEHPDRWNYFKDYLSPDSDIISEENKKDLLLTLLADDSGIYSDEQKSAVLNYVNAAEAYRGMVMGKEKQRAESGFNAQAEADVEDSYEAGRALVDEESDEGMIDAKNLLVKASEDLDRNMGCHAEELEETLLANGVYDSLEDRLARINPDHWGDEHVELFTKYMNARAKYDGMVERVQDDIDEKVASSHAFIDENVDQEGNITPAYLVDDERSVYVVNQSADGSSVVVRDAETGETKMVSAEQVRLTGETMSAEAVKAETEAAIREEESTKAASRIDGTVQLAPGNVYPVLIGDDETGEDSGQSSTLTIMQDNGDGTAVVMLGDNAEQQLTLSVDVIQGIVDAYHKTRLAQRLAEEKDAVEAATSSQPTEQVIANDMVDGVSSTIEQQPIVDGQEENNVLADEVDETALSRIPVDENGEQLFEKAPISDSWAALVEMSEGDTAEAKDTAEQMVQQAQKALEKEQKKKSAGGSTIMEIQKAKAAHKAALRDLQKRVDYWTNVANYEENMRKAEEEAKRRQRKMEQAERGRMLAKAGRYVEEYKALGPSQSFREYVLRAISSGALKFIWSDNTNGTKGLGAHLGLNTPTERGRRLWMQSNSDGVYPEVAAEGLLEGWAADQGMTGYADEATGMTSMDAFDELLDVLSSYDSPSAMFDEVMRMRSESQEYSDDEYAEMEALYHLEMEAEANGMSVDEWVTYNDMLAEHIKDVFDAVTDEEILSIFANEYEQNDYGRIRENDEVQQGLLEGQGSFEGDGGGHSMVQANGYDGRGDTEGRGEPSAYGVDDGWQQGVGELSATPVSGEHRGIDGIELYTESEVEDIVREHVEDIISVEGFEDVRIVGIKVIGSRVKGNASIDSDLDVLVEYEGNAREDNLFNLFNGGDVHEQLYIEGIRVDINPITRGKSGTIVQWLERNAGYNKETKRTNESRAESEAIERNNDEQWQADGRGVAHDTTGEVEGGNNRSDLRVFEEGLATSHNEYSEYSERARRQAESERLVAVAQKNGMFIPIDETKLFGDKHPKRTGESVVYFNEETGKVYKVKDPYAKSAMKSGVQPEDAAFEHLVHNLLFPETAYTLEGISEEFGDVRLILSQDYISTYGNPTKDQIVEALASRGLFPEDNYSFGNELVSVTDVEGDNVLLGEDGTVYFIDPIIRFKKPLREIIDALEHRTQSVGEQIMVAEADVNTNPTDKQKEAGNYKKGHVKIGSFNISIEQPKGSVRSGVDADGNKWETVMQNTYGYIRGTEGVDGDHIDVFLSNDIDAWDGSKVFVVDQYNEDGSFDEHKVMLGFNDIDEAYDAYLSNYSSGWDKTRKIGIRPADIDFFEKWIASSRRKTKPFNEYKNVQIAEKRAAAATASQRGGQMNVFDAAAEIAEKADRWHYTVSVDKETGETTLKREDVSGVYPVGDARFTVTASSPQEMLDILRNPMNGMEDVLKAVETTLENKVKTRRMDAAVNGQPKKVDVEGLFADLSKKGEAKLSDHVEKPVSANGNKLVTDERYAELRERMRKKLGGQMNMGIDPEILAIGTEMAVYHIEKGARKFADFARQMIADLGDAIRPYLKSFYNGARELPEVESAGLTNEMTPYDEVRTFDVANFDKPSVDMVAAADEAVKEQVVAEQEKTAKEAIKKERSRRKKSEDSLPLLGDLFNTNTESDERGNQETNESVGRGERQEGEGPRGRGTAGSRRVDNVPDAQGGRGVSELHSQPVRAQRNTRNFSFGEDGIVLASGEIGKLKANIAAIRTLKALEESGAEATAEQKQILSRYVGWGGLSDALNSDKYEKRNHYYLADRTWNEKYLPFYEELKGLLTEEEFNSAVQSTNTSHFTPDTVIRALWDIAQRMGFKHGRISEPAMGVGHIIGLMPRSIADASSISGFEIDSLSGRISKAIYPDADVKVQGYETAFAPQSKDLVITNVPFGKTAPYDKALDKSLRPKMKGAYNLHNYFIAKGLLELKEGGLGIFVTSSATMDGADSRFREFVMANGFDLVGAIRLPNNTFQKNAGTSVTADALVFRRRRQGEPSNGINFTSLTQVGEGSYQESGETRIKPILINEYFAEHPEMVLGDMMTAHDAGSGGLYSGASLTCKPRVGADLQRDLQEAVGRFDHSGNSLSQSDEQVNDEQHRTEAKNGTLVVQGDDVFVAMNGGLQPVESVGKKKEFVYNGKKRKVADAVNHYNALKARLNELIAVEQSSEGDPETLRSEVNRLYDDFVSKYGTLNRNKALSDVFAEDFEHNLPFSLEEVRRVPSATGKSMVWEVTKGKGILEKRVSYPISEPTSAENIQDAANISLSYHGFLDIPYMSQLLGEESDLIEERIIDEGVAYRDPSTGAIVDKESYLSGNVKEKLEQARAMAEEHPEYVRNVEALVEVQPETVRFGDISYRLGTPWIPAEYINQFAEEVLGVSKTRVIHVESINEFVVSNRAYVSEHSKAGLFRTDRLSAIDLFTAALNQRKPKVFDTRKHYDPTKGKYVEVRTPNEAETQAAAEKIMEISEKFVEYIDSKKDIHRELERIYNDKYNNYRLKNYSAPIFAHYPGASPAITLRDHQTRGVQRCLQGSTLLAHQVGTGKTFTMITSAMEMRRLGIARKPMIVVQNATLEDFVRDFYKLYPGARVLAPGKDERSAENRKRLFNLIATGDFDAIVIPQSFLSFIPDDEGRKAALIQKRIDEYEDALQQVEDDGIRRRMEREIETLRETMEGGDSSKKSRSVKDKAKAADRIKSKMSRQLDRRTDEVMTFEQMGIDALFIDEAHNYKKIGFASKMSNVKGIDTGASQRANSLLLKVQWVQEKNGGRNVVLATGTPITNTMAEVWTMMNFVAPEVLEDYGITSFDDFATTFGVVEPSLEFTATGNFKIADRFKSYVNVPELVKAFRTRTDVVLTEDVREFKESNNIPKLHEGQMTNEVIDKNEDLEDVMQVLIKRLEEYNNMSGQEKKKWSALPLVVFTKAKQAAIDLRLLNPTYADNPNSKTNKVVSNVVKLYRESNDYKGAQLVFCDSYQSPGEQPQMDLFDYDASVPRFNLYEDIKEKLVAAGIPGQEIAIINNYDGERRKALFEKVRNGDVRILLGSTEKMGVGVNVQDRLYAAHHIDAPIRPMDFEQRNGRILRQGNLHATWGKPVHVVTYGVQGTLDATAYDRLRIKQAFINQMMKGDVSGRVMEEQDDEDPSGMTFNQMAATLSGDKTAQLLFVAENKLKKLRNLKRSDANSKSSMGESIANLRIKLGNLEERRGVYERANEVMERSFPDGVTHVSVGDDVFTEKFGVNLDPIIDAYEEQYSLNRGTAPLNIYLNGKSARVIVHFNEGRMVYELYAGDEHVVEGRQFNGGRGLMSSIDHQLNATAKNLADANASIAKTKHAIAGIEEAMSAPWGKEEELRAAEEEVAGLRKQLEEKAAENTKSKGKGVSLSENEDRNEDGTDDTSEQGESQRLISDRLGQRVGSVSVGTVHDAIIVREATLRGEGKEKLSDEIVAAIRRFEKEQGQGKINIGHTPWRRRVLNLVRRLSDSEIVELKNELTSASDASSAEAWDALDVINRYQRRKEREGIVQILSGVKLGEQVPLSKIDELFESYNEDEDVAVLYKKVRGIAERIGLNVSFQDVGGDALGEYELKGNFVLINPNLLYTNESSNQVKATAFVHELIHPTIKYAVRTAELIRAGKTPAIELPQHVLEAAQGIVDIFDEIKDNDIFRGEHYANGKMYGVSVNAHEMVSELANPIFREKLKRIHLKGKNVFERLLNLIKRIFGIESAYTKVSKALETILEGFDVDAYNQSRGLEEYYKRKEESLFYREGEGAVSDKDVSFYNDPIAKFLGKPRYYGKKAAAFAERERRRMKHGVSETAEKLGLKVEIVDDAAMVSQRTQQVMRNHPDAKGWYDPTTGNIVVVVGNHVSKSDAVQTLLHEGIAHHGLRKLFGKHFDAFLDNVYSNAEREVREKINVLAQKNGWDLAKATEEYLASLAEDTEFEHAQKTNWWSRIKQFFLEMLTHAGVKLDIELSDNELRYILWRSYMNMAHPGQRKSFADIAEDVVMQSRLAVGNHSAATVSQRRRLNRVDRERVRMQKTGTIDTSSMIPLAAERDSDEGLMFRKGGKAMSARDRYNHAVRVPNASGSVKGRENLGYRMREAYQDSMSALRVLQDVIVEETGVEMTSGENAYMAENRMSSENKAQAEIYDRDFFRPLCDAVTALVKSGESYEMVSAYLMAKHGLERNLLMSEREVTEQGGVWDGKVVRDYSGLSALTGSKTDFTDKAQELVDAFEKRHDTADLWEKVNAATKETLRKSYDSGLMDKETYEKVRDMFEYYIPLRGWRENVAANEFEYLMKDGHLQLSPALKSMHGRNSVADDPIATIGFMAESTIVQGNRNVMKQKFLNFVLNRPTDLATVNEQWYVLDNATKEWEPRNPIIPEGATGDEVAAIVKQFEADMKALGSKAKKRRKGLKLKQHATVYEGQEHVVRVRRGGKEYCIYINGSPRAAQAVNGLTNPNADNSWLAQKAMDIKNFMARMFTSQNPAFIATNLSRDVIWAGTAVSIKEDKRYIAQYTKNISKAFVKAELPRLLYKYNHGTLDKNNELERYFDEFIRHGGETGFTQVNTVEDYKRNIRRFIKEAERGVSIPKKAWRGLWGGIEFLNRSAEDTTRFMVYMTSRQMGRDISRSVWDAKEITVNFNKKGSGNLGAKFMNFAYIFFNATIQGLANFGKLTKNHPGKMSAAMATFAFAGFLSPLLNEVLRNLFGDDDDEEKGVEDGGYWDLPEWVRRNNLVIRNPFAKDAYFTIPLSHELRPFFGMGELAYSVLMGKEDVGVALGKAAQGFSALLPLDYTGNGGNVVINLTPTIAQPIAQLIANKDYFGKPIYRKNDWNELYPEWTKAYRCTSAILVNASRLLNEMTGGDDVEKGWIDKWFGGYLNNPAIIEHLFESYFGGVGKTLNRTAKTFSMLWNDEMREWRNVPVVSSFYHTGDERTSGSQLNREYYDAVNEHKESQHVFSGYRSKVRDGVEGYAEKLEEFMNSDTFKRYSLIHEYKGAIDKLSKQLKSAGADDRASLEDAIRELKVEMLTELEAMSTGEVP